MTAAMTATHSPAAPASAPRFDATSLMMGLAFAVMWSSAFTSAKFVVSDAPPFMALSLRFLVSGLLACGIAFAMGQRPDLTRRQWMLVVVFGICQNSLYLGLNFLAMTRVEAGLAAIIASLLPLIVAAIGAAMGERAPPLGILGLVLGFAGVLVVMGARLSGGADPLGVLLCLIAAASLAAATLLVRGVSPGNKVLMIVGLQMLVGAMTLAPVALIFESAADIHWTPSLGIAFLYTTIVPGVLATVVWFLLVKRIGPVNAAAFHFLNPGFGVGVAALLLGESLTMRDVIGVGVATLGILLVQIARGPGPKRPAAKAPETAA